MTGDAPLGGCRILLVEDSYPQAMDASEWLVEAGAQVVGPAPNAAMAQVLLAQDPVDVAVVDINLGTGADYEIASLLAERGVPFILTTGYDRSAIDPRFADAPHVAKPVAKRKLLEAILSVV